MASAVTRQIAAHPALSWLAFTALLILGAAPMFFRPLWFDEIITYHLVELPTLADVWAAVRGGADASPPLFHEIVRLTFAAFGEGDWQLRLPSLAGFLALSGCLYLFVRRHCSVVAAWAAALAPLLTSGAAYMAEGRPYGIVVGFMGAALLCWQRSTARSGWSPWLAAATASVAGAASCQFFGIYALAPLACGEALHQLAGGRVHVGRWLTLAPALVPTVVMGRELWALLGTAGTDGWDTPTLASFASGYGILLGAALAPSIACLCVMAGLRSEGTGAGIRVAPWLPLADAVAGLGFLAVPALAVTIGLVAGGPFVPRYAIGVLVGFGVLAAGNVVLLERRRPTFAAVLLCAIIAGFGLQVAGRWMKVEPQFALPATLSADETDLPIVVEGPLDYLQLAYYAPPRLRERLVSLVDPSAAALYVGVRRGDLTLIRLQRFAPSLQIEQPATFFNRHRRFLVFRGADPGWVLPKMTAEGAHATLVHFRNTDALFEVRVP